MKLTEDVLRSMIADNLFTDEDIQQIIDDNKLRERIEKRIEIHQRIYNELKNKEMPDDKSSMFKACQIDMLNELQKLLEESKNHAV